MRNERKIVNKLVATAAIVIGFAALLVSLAHTAYAANPPNSGSIVIEWGRFGGEESISPKVIGDPSDEYLRGWCAGVAFEKVANTPIGQSEKPLFPQMLNTPRGEYRCRW
jgi:hypothetical protein